MHPHPDFADRPLPRTATLGPFALEPLAPRHVDEDYAVVMASAEVLEGLFDHPWPEGLTLERNLEDLERHAREFDAGQAFAWIVRAEDAGYLGCAYVNPVPGERGRARVVTWMRAGPDRLAQLARFNARFRDWLEACLPAGYALDWRSNDRA